VAEAAPGILVVAILSLTAMLLNTGALELSTRAEIDPDRELRLTGATNLAMASVGAPPGYVSVSMTTIGLRMGVSGRLLASLVAAIAALALAFAEAITALVPVFVTTGLLAYLGLGFLHEWLVLAARRLPRGDVAVIYAIVAITAAVGFLEAILVGLVIAVLAFALAAARVPVLRGALTLAEQHSTLDRSPNEIERLRAAGSGTLVATLEGVLFFGTGHQLVTWLRERLAGQSAEGDLPVRAAVVDLSRVTGLDMASAMALARAEALAARHGATLELSGVAPELRKVLEAAGLGHLARYETLDRALEAQEETVLAAPDMAVSGMQAPPSDPDRAALLTRLPRRIVQAGETVLRRGDPSGDMLVLESGRVSIMRAGADGPPVRLRDMRAGAVLGEIGFAAGVPRTQDVVATERSVLRVLDRATLAALEADAPRLAFAAHRLIAEALSEKVMAGNRMAAVERM
ncbi:MAG: cyclic nucleotide-binding domain-containing protein, partial [Pseudomonadota bacterium]